MFKEQSIKKTSDDRFYKMFSTLNTKAAILCCVVVARGRDLQVATEYKEFTDGSIDGIRKMLLIEQ